MRAIRKFFAVTGVFIVTLLANTVVAQETKLTPEATATGTPDPTLLPVATTSQQPQTSAYNALNVPALAAGASYNDPFTGVKVYKVTSATFPAGGNSYTHDYAEGGNEVSLPLNASGTRAVHVYTGIGNQWIIDFTPGAGVSNVRSLSTSAFPPFMNLCVTFSSNPSTPYYMYVSTGSTIYRVDVRTMTEVPGGGWPVTGETEAMWLHQNENDSFFTWMRGANGSTIVGYEPATGIKKTYTNAGVNEPRIDRDATDRYVCLSMTTPQNQALFWDWKNNVIKWSSPTQSFGGDPPVAHQASLRGYWVGVNWNVSFPWPFYSISPTPNSIVQPLPGGGSQGGGHCDGNWNQHPATANDQWFACYYYGAIAPAANVGALAPGGILLSTANGQRRILAHLYNSSTNYTYYSFAKLSPDGAYVLFTSDMNGSARSDLFLAELPTSGTAPPPPADTTPPTASITAPANGATISGTVSVTANATDNVGVVGVQFTLDGLTLGAEVTTAPYMVSWNTTTAANGVHTLTAVARDAAGNHGTSATVSVTVSNSTADTTPPSIPTGVVATAVSSTQINLTWNASTDAGSGVAGYKVFRGGTQIATSATTSYSDKTLAASTTYTYTVAAYDVAGNTSAQSVSASATTQAPPPPPPSTGPIVLLHLDELAGSTTFADASGSNNNAACTGVGCPTAGVVGKVGRALSFDGASRFVAIPANTALNAFPLTVITWFKTTSTTGVSGLVNKYVANSYNGYNIFLNNGNLCAWYIKDASNYAYDGSGCTFNVPGFNDGTWHQLAYVVDATGGKFYVDAVQKGTTVPWTGVAGAPTTLQDVQLGHYPGAFGGVEYYTGQLDEVRIYNRALSLSEINTLYTADNPPPGDTTPPTVAITSPANGATVSATVSITANASDNVGVAGVQFMLDNVALGAETTTAPYSIPWNTTTAANGAHSLTAVARDAAGNKTTSAAVSVTVFNDTTPPAISITAPASGATVSSTVTVTASASDNVGVVGVQILVDNAALGAELTAAPYSIAWNTTTVANGAHSLTAVARDAAGNKTTSAAVSVTVFNDTTPPTISITAPANGATVSSTVTVSATATDNAGVVGVQFLLDNAGLGAELTAAPYTMSWNTTTAANGAHSLTAVARDAAGNKTVSAAVSVTVSNPVPDTTPPTVSITSPLNGSTVSATVTVSANASDNVGVAGVQFMLDGAALGLESKTSPYSTSWNTANSTNGSHVLAAVARDAAGNQTTSAAVTVTVSNATPDTTPPTVPTGLTATAVSSTQINLTWTASTDSQSGVAGYKVFRNGVQIATATTTSFSDVSLTASTMYTYTVAAYDVAGNVSAQSTSASATTQAITPPPPSTAGPIMILHLDEAAGSTTFADASGSNNNGSCTGVGCPTAGVVGRLGSALSFDGLSDLVSVPHNAGLNTLPLTVAAWFKTTSTTGVVGLVNKYVANSYNGYNVFLNNGHLCAWYIKDSADFAYDGSGCTFNVIGFNDGGWHHVVYVVDATAATLYVDGAQKGTIGWTGTAGPTTTLQDVQLGHYPGAFGGAEYYTGALDEVRIYNKALTASEVTALYGGSPATPPPAPPDTTPPAVSITSPVNGATVSSNVMVNAIATDNVGVAGVQFMVDGTTLGSESLIAPFSTTWQTTMLANGAHTLTAVARDAAGNKTTSVPVTVTVFNGESPFHTTAALVPGRIEAEDFDFGGEGVAYHDLTAGNQGGYYRTGEDVDITSPWANGYVINDFQTGEWLKYMISVSQSGTYQIQLLVSSAKANSRFHLEIDNVAVGTQQSVPNTGSLGSFTWVSLSGVNLTAGPHVLKVVVDQEMFNFDAISTVLELAAPAKSRAARH